MPVSQTMTFSATPPATGQSPDTFNANAIAVWNELKNTTIPNLNIAFGQMNTLEENVNAKEASAVSAASTATTKAQLATDYAEKTGLEVETGAYSAKEHAIGDLTASGGSAKAWAIDSASPDGTTSKSAKTHAEEAAVSAAAALASEMAAAAIADSMDDRYLGAKMSDPTVDNDGNPLQNGALYWFYNPSSPSQDCMKVYDLELGIWVNQSFMPTDHSGLSGLSNDDHPQYHNDTRGDARYYTKTQIDTNKQDKLASGTNIKTIGGQTILGSGDIALGNPTINSNKSFALNLSRSAFITKFPSTASASFTAINAVFIGNYLYFCGKESIGTSYYAAVYKVNLSTYTLEAYNQLNLSTASTYDPVLHYDGTDLYIVMTYNLLTTDNIHFQKLDASLNAISGFTAMTKGSTSNVLSVLYPSRILSDSTYFYFIYTYDTTYDAAYFVRSRKDGTETKIINFTIASTSLSDSLNAIAQDSTYVYVSAGSSGSSQIAKINKSTMAVSNEVEFNSIVRVIGVDTNYVYCTNTGQVVYRLNISDLSFVDAYDYGISLQYAYFTNGKIYCTGGIIDVVAGTSYAYTAKQNQNTFINSYSSILNSNVNSLYSDNFYNIVWSAPNNITYGSSHYSDRSMLSFVASSATKKSKTSLSTSSLVTIGTVFSSTPTIENKWASATTFPLSAKLDYVDQI